MKAVLFFVLVLVAVTWATQSVSYSKMNMNNADLARMVSEALLGARQDVCSGLCIVHFGDHVCYPGVERAECDATEYPVGPQEETGCFCCLS